MMSTPRLEIDLKKIQQNTRCLIERLSLKGITLTGVTKVTLGNPEITRTLLRAGVNTIGDSRIENIQRMRQAGIKARFILIRTPLITKADLVVEHADVSFNTELAVIEKLSQVAVRQNKTHQILLMIELGDLREGIPPEELNETVEQVLGLPRIKLIGIGTNLACLGGIKPDHQKMKQLSDLAQRVEKKFNLTLEYVSGGNSANLEWLFGLGESGDIGRINNLRLGESIFLGLETLNRGPIEGLHTDAFTLVTEVIESKTKPSVPSGEICQDAFGKRPDFQSWQERGKIHHAILGIGRQDVLVSGLTSLLDEPNQLELLGASSDHMVIATKGPLTVGEQVRFRLNYGALLAAMTSPFVEKCFL